MAPVRGSAPRRAKTMHKTASFAATNHPQHTATCCPNTSGQSASIELVAAPQVVVCRPHAVAAQPSRCSPERPHQCDRSAPPVQFSPRVSCRHKAYTTISLSPSLVFLAVPPLFPPLSFRPVWGGRRQGRWSPKSFCAHQKLTLVKHEQHHFATSHHPPVGLRAGVRTTRWHRLSNAVCRCNSQCAPAHNAALHG